MTWNFVGEHTFTPDGAEVNIGEFNLSEGQDTIWARVTQLNEPGDWPFSFGILSWRSSEGNELGSIKIYPTQFGEVFRLTCGRAPLVGAGSIWFEPRGYNLQWIKAGYPWTLRFEAQAGRGALENQIWERAADTIFPVNEGDDLDMKGGCITSGCLKVQPPDEEERDVPSYQQGVWTPVMSKGAYETIASRNVWSRIGNTIVLSGYLRKLTSTATFTIDVSGAPYPASCVCSGAATGNRIGTSVGGITQCYIRDSDSAIQFLCTSDAKTNPWESPKYSDANDADNGLYFSVSYLTDDTSWTPSNGAEVVSDMRAFIREERRAHLKAFSDRRDPDSADLDLEAL